jgi:hypothetical protein
MASLKATIAHAFLPAWAYRRLAFSRVYRKGAWGSDGQRFYSGDGSRGAPVDAYVEAVSRELDNPDTIVDLGCGDFTVGRELVKRFPNARYIGCDIVPAIIKHHQQAYGSDRVSFRGVDMVSGPIPAGDVHLVRQVFQHLSNADILRSLDNLRGSPCLIVSESQPLVRTGPVNPDKQAGGDVRFNTHTGVGAGLELDKPPFNRKLEELCRVKMPGSEEIVTWRVRPKE